MAVSNVEEFVLPSKGKLYSREVNPVVRLRSMTVLEEMKRLAPTEMPYKTMCGIIEDCLESKLEIPVYDLVIGDYQFLLHKLRIVTYGNSCKFDVTCPNCGKHTLATVDLDSLEVVELNEEDGIESYIDLPKLDVKVGLKYQTPRDFDNISFKNRELQKKSKGLAVDQSLIFTISSLIDTVDGQTMNDFQKEAFVKKLPMSDANDLLKHADKLNRRVGINPDCIAQCSQCGGLQATTFRITNEFLRPSDE